MAHRVLNRENIFMVNFDYAAAVTVFIGVPGDDGRQVVWQAQDETQDTCFCHNGESFQSSGATTNLKLGLVMGECKSC